MKKKRSKENKWSPAKKRAVGTIKLLSAFGVVQSKSKGSGRPVGTYKYGSPIQNFKKQQSRKKALYDLYRQQQEMNLSRRGLTKESIQQLQQARTTNTPPPQQVTEVADDELAFKKFLAEKTVSPNTQRILDEIRRIQNKGKMDNIEQQRRHKERTMVGRKMNLMKAHENMVKVDMDFTGVNEEENILFAPSVFKEDQENNILRTNRLNLLQTKEGGNDLGFV